MLCGYQQLCMLGYDDQRVDPPPPTPPPPTPPPTPDELSPEMRIVVIVLAALLVTLALALIILCLVRFWRRKRDKMHNGKNTTADLDSSLLEQQLSESAQNVNVKKLKQINQHSRTDDEWESALEGHGG